MADDWKIDVGVPDVGDLVEYGGNQYRVRGWMRKRHQPSNIEVPHIIDGILFYDNPPEAVAKLQWCYRDEAQFVALTGVAGAVAPIEQVRVVGKVTWPQEHIDEARQQANILAENSETTQ